VSKKRASGTRLIRRRPSPAAACSDERSRLIKKRTFADLPLLADALEDAGCTNAAVRAHCRTPGEHVRGCWVLDLPAGKS